VSSLTYVLILTGASGALSAFIAGGFMLLPAARRNALLPHLVSFATGALLGAALLALLPHALDSGAGAHGIGLALACGIIAFFVLEKMVLWRHCHVDACEAHGPQDHHRDRASATLILWGDAFHNVLDGVLIAAAFLTNPHLGVVTTVTGGDLGTILFKLAAVVMMAIFTIKALKGKPIHIAAIEDLTNWLEEKLGPVK